MRLDIENKILIPFLILIIVPTMVVGGVFYWNSYKLMVDSQKDSMEGDLGMALGYMDALSQDVRMGIVSEDRAKQKALEYFGKNSGSRMVIYDAGTGQVLSGPDGFEIPDVKGRQMIFENSDSSIRAFAGYPDWGWVIGISSSTYRFSSGLLEIQKYTLLVAIVGIIIAVELSIVLAHNISRPIKNLSEVCDSISEGKLEGSIPLKRGDEIGVLARAFNNMLIKQRENNRKLVDMKKSNEDILRSIDIGIIGINKKGRVIGINQAAKSLLEGRYVVRDKDNRNLGTLFFVLMGQLNRTLQDKKPMYNLEWQVEGAGDARYLELNTNLLRSEEGSINGAICSFADITRRKKLENRIERVNRLVSLGELAAGLAHEIRNPLAGMQTCSQVLYNRLKDNPSSRSLIDGVLYEIDRLDGLITNLLDFAKPHPANREKVDITVVINKAVELMENRMIENKIKLNMFSDASDSIVCVDQNQMEQVFLNVIMNAVKAMEGGGSLFIKIFNRRGSISNWVTVSFEDTGKGIESENINRIFDPFYTTDPKGTGLGLSVVHKLVTENDGIIEVQSKPGEGTAFVIGLPLTGGEFFEEKDTGDR